MASFSKILVPLDGSRLAEAVLPVAKLFAERFDATVSLLHVLERGAPRSIHGERHLDNAHEAGAYLSRIAGECDCEGVPVEIHVHPNQERDVVASIIQHAAEFGADLIILASHGWGGIRDLVMGSIAQQVLRRGVLPVLLVRPSPSRRIPEFRPRRMLVPLDGNPSHDGAVLPIVEELAVRLGCGVHLVIVVPTQPTVYGNQAAIARLTPRATTAALEMEQEDARAYLERTGSRLLSAGIHVTAEVRRGDPAVAIADEAEHEQADLFVMATHAKSGWDALWASSVGSKVLGRLTQPMLLVRAAE